MVVVVEPLPKINKLSCHIQILDYRIIVSVTYVVLQIYSKFILTERVEPSDGIGKRLVFRTHLIRALIFLNLLLFNINVGAFFI